MTNITAMVFLHMFHGRDTADEEMDDWGYDGPTLGPFTYIHTTYGREVKFAMELAAYKMAFPEDKKPHYQWDAVAGCNLVEGYMSVIEGCLKFRNKFYGDWSVFTAIVGGEEEQTL